MPPVDMARYMRDRRAARRAAARLFLGARCAVCGESKDLEFDHIDPKTKIATVTSPGMLDGPESRFWEEVNKCQLLCIEHHRNKTRQESKGRQAWNKGVGGPLSHGTTAMYSEGFCRCDRCVAAKRLYRVKKIGYHEEIS